MRLFLAYDLPMDLQNQIYQTFSELHQRVRNFQWIKPPRLHLTLRFLGEVPEKTLVNTLLPLFEEEFSKQKELKLSFQGVGVFPNLERPRTFWLGVKGEALMLRHQAAQLEKKLANEPVHQDHKAFSPHVTLAKLREIKNNLPFEEWIQEFEKVDFGTYLFKAPTLFESILEEGPSAYRVVKHFGEESQRISA